MNEHALAARVVAVASQRGVRLAVAESLTGGLVASAIVSIPGASEVFAGGIVAYDSELKRTLLGVDDVLLREQGPVHPEVAKQMASGVREVCAGAGAISVGVATTGVAGPGSDPERGQPPGTVWIGMSSEGGETATQLALLGGSRQEIREAAVAAALEAILLALKS